MIRLLFPVIFSEMALILLFLFNGSPKLWDLLVTALDELGRGSGPVVVKTVVVKTVAGTVSLVLLSNVYGLVKIRNRSVEEGALCLADQVLMATHLLESTLIGAALFLALMINRLHHDIRDICLRRKEVEAIRRQKLIFALKVEATALQTKFSELQRELGTRKKEITTAKINAVALRRQSEGFLVEYNRLLEENKKLRIQLQKLDLRTSRSIHKKNL